MRIADYEILEELARNDWQVLSRARQHGGESTVLVKHPRRRPPRLADLELLKHEFELLRELSIPGIPKPLGVPHGEEGYPLFLEDCGGRPLQALIRSFAGDLDRFFPTAIELCSILAALHRSEVIHHNLNPRGIFLDPDTGKLTVVDFSSATLASGGMHHPLGAVLSPLGLPYSSPEQTGRMNRDVDHRTDFYSLGVTLYELLTGSPPFESPDQLELIHWHIARAPIPLREHDARIPEVLSQIVLKLLSKTPEERYQSAAGIKEDLEACAEQWQQRRSVTPFALGSRDISDRFLIPQKLYGREREVESLVKVFEGICRGGTALTLVAGYSGIGKTSLIQELYRPIVHQRGYFLSGKFDQVVRSTPYGAPLQVFRGLVRRLLGENEQRLLYWQRRLGEAVGANGGVLTEVIPELALILGAQPAPPALGPTEAQNRFQMVFQAFLGALAASDHPFVIFLDDLQWADSATLRLLEPLLTSADIHHLLLIGAYRDNEVDAGHPLLRTLGRLHSAGAEVQQITLGPLPAQDLTAFIADALRRPSAEVATLADLIRTKTDGNPFYVIEFLKSLRHDGLLAFDYAQGHWNFQVDAIAAAATAENVVDLMTRKIRRLSAETQRILPLAACIGGRFDLATMATITQQPAAGALADLKEALQEGLILQSNSPEDTSGDDSDESAPISYAFLHDRVQQAAYSLIPETEKQRVRLQVGRLLLERWSEAAEDKLFDVIEHLNFGSALITSASERRKLAQLNLVAARKAKSSTAYDAALGYATAGVHLLANSTWESDYELMFALHLEAAECEYLCGRFDAAEQHFGPLLERAREATDKAAVHHLRLVQNENRSRYPDAVRCGREGLALLGVSFPDDESGQQAALEREMDTIQTLLAGRPIASLVELPAMRDREKRMVMKLLTSIWAPAYITANQLLTRLISATLVRLSLEHGSTEESAYGYVTHAITVGPVREDYQTAYEWGELALRVNERFPDPVQRAKIHQQFHAHVALWRRPFAVCIPHAREACRSGLETGDFNYAAYGAFTESWSSFLICPDLSLFVTEQSGNLALLEKMRMTDPLGALTVIVNWARALQGQTANGLSLSYGDFDEDNYRETYGANPFFMTPYYTVKLSLCLFFEAHDLAAEAAARAREIVQSLSGTVWPPVLGFLYGLAVTALFRDAQERQRSAWLAELAGIQRSLDVLAANCAENWGCFASLLRAETARVEDRELDAVNSYEEALRLARSTGNVQNGARAHELYSRFWRMRGNEGVAAYYLRQASQLYAQWGAKAKVRSLEERWPGMLGSARAAQPAREPVPETAVTSADAHAALDLATVTKAARAISQEIDLHVLLQRLMKIAIENAGAQRGLLLSEREGGLVIEAEGWVDRDEVEAGKSEPLEARSNVSKAVVQFVHKARESVVLGDAAQDERFRSDAYVASSPHLSILCVPIVHQGKSQGILYLENQLAGRAFTPARAQTVHLLASQAAISLENSRLYEEMRQEAHWRGRAEEMLRSVVEGTASVTGGDFFRSLVRHLASALGVRYAFVTQCQTKTQARMLAFWNGSDFSEPVEYDVGTTPCRTAFAGNTGFYPRHVQTLFPDDADLVALGAESYLGLPMFGTAGGVIGHLAVLDVEPMLESQQRVSVLKIFAARAAAELERLHAENSLRAALGEVERLKNQLQAENVYLQEEIRREHNFDEIVGSGPGLLQLLSQVEDVAPTDSTVLIYGETGTGKELIARAIHNRSSRSSRPLVKVNCGAISAGLVESELFGHVKGAFTGALDRRAGRFELADGGTIFLDEVGELPLETQVKLLRVLQEQEFEPVGSSRTQRVDVRVIAATNRDLEKEVAAGRFRLDLFYRLNVLPLNVPALRERRGDIPQLVTFFLQRFSRKFGKKIDSVTQETMERLVNYSWPGNVRELQNVIERAFVLTRGSVLALDGDLLPALPASSRPQPLASQATGGRSAAGPLAAAGNPPNPGPTALNEVERLHILAVLEQSGWVIEGPKGAAALLRLHPNTLRSRLKKLGIQRPTHEIS